jgi:hypothetical protein
MPKVTPSTVIWVGRADEEGLVAEAELAVEAVARLLRTLEGMSLARMLESTLEGREVRTDVGLAVEAPEGKRLVGRLLRMLEMTPDGSSVKMPLGRAVENGRPGVRLVLLAPRIPEATLEGMSLARMLESTLEGSEVRTEVGLRVEAPEGKRLVGRSLRMLEMTPDGSSVKMLVGRGTGEKVTPGRRLVLLAPRTPETTLDKTPEGRSLRMLETTPEGSSVRMPLGITEGTLPRMLETTPVGRSDRMLERILVGKSVRIPVGRGTADKGTLGRRVMVLAPRTPETTLDSTPEGKSLKMLETTPVGNSVRIPVGITEGTLPRTLDTRLVGRSDRMLEMTLVGKSVKMPVGRPEVGRSVRMPVGRSVVGRSVTTGRSLGRLPSTLDTTDVGRADKMLESSLGRSVAAGRSLRVLTMLEMTPVGSVAVTSDGKLVTTEITLDKTPVGSASTELGLTARLLVMMLAAPEARVDTSEGRRLPAALVRPAASESTVEAAGGRSVKTLEGREATTDPRLETAAGRSLVDGRPATSESTLETTGFTVLTTLGRVLTTLDTRLVGRIVLMTLGTATTWALEPPMNCKPAAPRATIL